MMGDESPEFASVPIGLAFEGSRSEFDSLGTVDVPADRYWGAQTQRCLRNFPISTERMPLEVVRAYGLIKRAAANANAASDRLAPDVASAIVKAAEEVADGAHDDEFPLLIWQSGSGTQTNMNVNEVIANRAIQLLGGTVGTQEPVAPNQHVNMSQSTNDTFVTAMHVAALEVLTTVTLPGVQQLRDALASKSMQWRDEVKTGRTHLQDATPLTVGQEWSAFVAALDAAIANLEFASQGLLELAMGGTAVGTGVNATAQFAHDVIDELRQVTGHDLRRATNTFAAQSTLDALVRSHAALKALAVTLFKIANDLRWLGSGPHTGLAELRFPPNEPGSSIMPGKVNPTQAEVMLMVCTQVFGADVTVSTAGAEGNLQLNAFRPVVIDAYLRSARTIGQACASMATNMIEGTEIDRVVLARNVDKSIMLVTALAPVIGYHEAAQIAQYAVAHDTTLRKAALANGISAELFDERVRPIDMTSPDPQ